MEGMLELWNPSCWGIWGHKQTKRLSTQSNMVKQPICHADQGPARLSEQAFGTTGTEGRQTGQWGGGGWRRFRLREAREASTRKDGRHLLHHVLGSHGDKTEHPTPPYSSRSGSTHSPRAHSMVADRRGWWARFSSFAAAPHSCF